MSEGAGAQGAPLRRIVRRASGNLAPSLANAQASGPLNSTTTPQAQALPVKRRGSFQLLKRGVAAENASDENNSSSQNGKQRSAPARTASGKLHSEDSPTVFAEVKKATHWEKYGTVMVLYIRDDDSASGEICTQILMAEGYDIQFANEEDVALSFFQGKDVYPDVVLLDAEWECLGIIPFIRQLTKLNQSIAILVLGAAKGGVNAIDALQAGAADFVKAPVDYDEVVARIERHVQRQHFIKVELEKALEEVQRRLAEVKPVNTVVTSLQEEDRKFSRTSSGSCLESVGEDPDFEEQILALSMENQHLAEKLMELEEKLEEKHTENQEMAERLAAVETRLVHDYEGVQGHIAAVEAHVSLEKNALEKRVENLERTMQEITMSCSSVFSDQYIAQCDMSVRRSPASDSQVDQIEQSIGSF